MNPGSYSENNKRIARNTLMLYFRMLLMMFIGLFTSRVILNALGISDLGLMNVASGVIGMFTFLNGTLASGTQRFLNFELGSGDSARLKKTFETAMTLHALMALVIVVLSETIGLWYVYHKLNVEPGRFHAAMWCFQISIISTVVTIIQIPFSSSLIAHEKMDIYAYMSIYDAAVKLISAYLIQATHYDRVIFYSALTLFFSLTSTYIYNLYCRKHFEECSFSFSFDKGIFRKMFSFSGWNTVGCLAAMAQSVGVNLAINFFCGTVINGARSIAFQANGWVTRFVGGFQTAMNPQIVKYYASGDMKGMSNLVIRGAQLSSYLLMFLGIPLFIEIEWVINLWLGHCPEYVPIFLRLVLIETLFRTMGDPTIIAMHATGEMKWLNVTVGSVLLLILPVTVLLFRLGLSVEIVVAVNIIPWIIAIPIRLFLLKRFCGFPMRDYILKTFLKVPLLAVILFLVPYYVGSLINVDGIVHFLVIGTVSVFWSCLILYTIGIDKGTREIVKTKVIQFVRPS